MPNRKSPPPTILKLATTQILAWADDFYARVGRWPRPIDGPIAEGVGLTWGAVEYALQHGTRGLPGGSALAQLLVQERGLRRSKWLPKLTEGQILAWVDAFHKRTQTWPRTTSGLIPDSGGESWISVDRALRVGNRGLPGDGSLARLLARCRGVRNKTAPLPLTVEIIVRWAEAHYRRTGRWPTQRSGAVVVVPHETWQGIDNALRWGGRGLPGGSSISQLLATKRPRGKVLRFVALEEKEILAWSDAHHRRCGVWPRATSGQIVGAAEGQTWWSVDAALREGRRGLPGGSTLYRFLQKHRRLGTRR